MPFTDEQSFLDAIFARYHDDGLRFIYADFLDDSGDPERAELVRIQVALSKITEDHPRWPQLKRLQDELLSANQVRWCEHLNGLVSECEFRRGVLDSVVVDARTFLAKGDELFRRGCFRRVRLRDSSGVMADLAASPLIAKVTELNLCGDGLGNGGVNLLARSQFLKNLESLDLTFNGIDNAGVHTLARTSTLAKLTSLSLRDNEQINSEGIKELAESPFFAGLTALDVSGNDIDDTGLQAVISSSKSLTRLQTLRLSENPIGDAGIAVLTRSPLFERMCTRSSRLEFRGNKIGPLGATALAGSPLLSRCHSLDLTRNEIGDRGLVAILRSQHLQNLRVLKVGRNLITDAAIMALRETWPRFFQQLRNLDLSENRLTNSGIAILEKENAADIVDLDVERNLQTSAGGETPVSVSDLVPGVLQTVSDLADAAALRRRVSHPSMRASERPNQTG